MMSKAKDALHKSSAAVVVSVVCRKHRRKHLVQRTESFPGHTSGCLYLGDIHFLFQFSAFSQRQTGNVRSFESDVHGFSFNWILTASRTEHKRRTGQWGMIFNSHLYICRCKFFTRKFLLISMCMCWTFFVMQQRRGICSMTLGDQCICASIQQACETKNETKLSGKTIEKSRKETGRGPRVGLGESVGERERGTLRRAQWNRIT